MRRRSVRYQSFLRGILSTEKKSPYAECIVTDISATGAKLFLTDTFKLPDNCVLHIDARQVHLGCHVVYREDNVVGIEFLRLDLPSAHQYRRANW